MQKIKWMGGLFFFLSLNVFAGTLHSQIDRDSIYQNETFVLTVAVDAMAQDQPDFSALEQDFTVHGIQKNSQVQIINGNARSQTRWLVTLMPKKEGMLLVPANMEEITIASICLLSAYQQSLRLQMVL